LAAEKAQSETRTVESNDAALGKVKDVAGRGDNAVAAIVANVKLAGDDDLHLMILVLIDERRAGLLAVKARRDGLVVSRRAVLCVVVIVIIHEWLCTEIKCSMSRVWIRSQH
jgi:hypothetical protein